MSWNQTGLAQTLTVTLGMSDLGQRSALDTANSVNIRQLPLLLPCSRFPPKDSHFKNISKLPALNAQDHSQDLDGTEQPQQRSLRGIIRWGGGGGMEAKGPWGCRNRRPLATDI